MKLSTYLRRCWLRYRIDSLAHQRAALAGRISDDRRALRRIEVRESIARQAYRSLP